MPTLKSMPRNRTAHLVAVYHYLDTSWGDKVPSSRICYITPFGKLKTKDLYGVCKLSYADGEKWLAAKYRPSLINLFGLIYFL